MNEPDLERLQAIRDELHQLGDTGRLTKQEFDRLWTAAVEAANGHDECLEGIEMSAESYGVTS
jgi:ribosomal protein L19E